MSRLVFILFLITCYSMGYSQMSNVKLIGGAPVMINPYNEIEGSPYLMNGEWGVGSLVDKNGDREDYVPMRYNSYEDTFEYRSDDKTYIFDKSDLIECLIVYITPEGNKQTRHFKKGVVIPTFIQQDNFVEILFEGTYFQLLEKHSTELQKHVSASYGSMQIKKFVNYSQLWILLPNSYREVKRLNSQVFVVNFPDYKKQIRKFVRQNEIIFTNYSDVYNLCEYIDNLIREHRQ